MTEYEIQGIGKASAIENGEYVRLSLLVDASGNAIICKASHQIVNQMLLAL